MTHPPRSLVRTHPFLQPPQPPTYAWCDDDINAPRGPFAGLALWAIGFPTGSGGATGMGVAIDEDGNVFNGGTYTMFLSNPGQASLAVTYIYLGVGAYTTLTGGEPNFYYVKINVREMSAKASLSGAATRD